MCTVAHRLRCVARTNIVVPVNPDTVYTRTLRRALDTLGGVAQLAAALGVSVVEVEAWLGGLEPPPAAFLRAIDIVAQGGLGRAPR